MHKNYYDVLEVKSDVSDLEIKVAFRRLAKMLHPDVSKNSSANEQFLLLFEAYSTLIDIKLRKQYDHAMGISSGIHSHNISEAKHENTSWRNPKAEQFHAQGEKVWQMDAQAFTKYLRDLAVKSAYSVAGLPPVQIACLIVIIPIMLSVPIVVAGRDGGVEGIKTAAGVFIFMVIFMALLVAGNKK